MVCLEQCAFKMLGDFLSEAALQSEQNTEGKLKGSGSL